MIRLYFDPRRQKPPVDSEQEVSDDNEEEWTYAEGRSKGLNRKLKKEKLTTSSPHRSGRGPGRPPKQHKDRGLSHGASGTGAEGGASIADFHTIKVSPQWKVTFELPHRQSLLIVL